MTSDRNINKDVENLRSAALNDNWYKVLDMYENKKELRMSKITKGDTVLHMAVSSGREYVVKSMVDIVCGARTDEQDTKSTSLQPVDENGNEKKDVLGAKNDQGNTPLHLAASIGNVGMCKKIVGKDSPLIGDEKKLVLGAQNEKGNTPLHLAASTGNAEICKMFGGTNPSLIAERNHAGETPLFLAAFHGHRKAFLWLHYQFIGSPEGVAHCIKRDNDDTILHCALERDHIDVAIEIAFLYKDHLEETMMMRNKNGLSPLHILAVNPSAFESTELPGRSYFVQLLYHWFFRVKKKEQPTTSDELKELEQLEREPCIRSCLDSLKDLFELYRFGIYDGGSYWVAKIRRLICYSLYYLSRILLFPLSSLEYLFTAAGDWFRRIHNMKEKHTWSLQIMEQLLSVDSCKRLFKKPYKEESGSKIVDTPLMIAAKNGVVEMVEKILKEFPSTMKVVNKEGKNIVLLASEKRQTKLYHILCGNENVDKSLFRQVDKYGNTALHLAAKVGVELDMQETTMVEEYKWFQLVERSMPFELSEKYNNDGKTAKEIFRDSYKEHMKSDRKWLDQTSQTCSVASTLVASMAFSFIVSDKLDKNNSLSLLLALSLSLMSTIFFLAILAFRSQSLKFWKYAPFIIQMAILTMFGSIGTLWISLMIHSYSLTTHAVLGTSIAILTVWLPIFIGPSLMSLFNKIPPPSRKTTSAFYYQKPETATDSNPQKEEIAAVSNLKKKKMQQIRIPKPRKLQLIRTHKTKCTSCYSNNKAHQEPTPNMKSRANDSLQNIGSPLKRFKIKRMNSL